MRLQNFVYALTAATLLNHGGIAYAEKVKERKMNEPVNLQTQNADKPALHPRKKLVLACDRSSVLSQFSDEVRIDHADTISAGGLG